MLQQQDKKPHIKPPPMKVQSNKTLTGNFPKNQNLKEDKKVNTETSESVSKRAVKSLPPGQLQHDRTYGGSSEKNISLEALGGTKSSHDTGIKSRSKLLHQEVHINEDKVLTDFSTTSSEIVVKVSERVLDDHRHQPSKMLHGKRDSGGKPVIEESHQPEISSRNSQKSNIQGVAAQICTSTAKCADRHNPFQRSGGWIFPDEAIHFCITTSGKKVMDFLGGCNLIKPGMHQDRKSLCPPENAEDQQVSKFP